MDAAIKSDAHDHHDLPPPPPPRLYERLRQIAGYNWDESKDPFHTTYDFWHVFGTRFLSPPSPTTASIHSISPQPHSPSPHNATSPGSGSKAQPGRDYASSSSGYDSLDGAATPMPRSNSYSIDLPFSEGMVVARISYHPLREERAFHIASSLIATADPDGEHIVRPIDLIRLAPMPGDKGIVTAAIYEYPGKNYLFQVLDSGPAFYTAHKEGDAYEAQLGNPFKLEAPIQLNTFLDFAIGATQCLEILHHSQGMVHGELRPDAFHFNIETNRVKIVAFGTGLRSFEKGLTSTGWSTLSRELGAKNKLQYISPEQTGRMPAEPDSRTDIYSLGVLFWILLTQRPVFEGDSPLDIVQGVLGRRIPNVSTVRIDIPDVIGRIIQKCTAKNIGDRYHSASGLRHDLVQVQKFLGDGDSEALKDWEIGAKDVSAFFILPTSMIGRQQEKEDLLKVIDRVAKSHSMHTHRGLSSRFSDGSGMSTENFTLDDISSSGASSADGNIRRSGSFTFSTLSDPRQTRNSVHQSLLSDTQTMETSYSGPNYPRAAARPWERHPSISIESRSLVDSSNAEGTRLSMADGSSSSLSRKLGNAKFRRRGHCEVVLIEGAGGLGKSCLVQTVLTDARRRGYCATAKFDTARRTAFGPLLKLLSSLFKQVWGERNTETPFHQGLKQYIRPVWPMLHRVLGLPEFLLGPPEISIGRLITSSQNPGMRSSGRSSAVKRRGSSPGSSPSTIGRHPSIASSTSQDYLRAGSSTKTMRLMSTFLDVLRVFTSHKFICFCLDDLHFADDESMELISQIVAARMKMVIIITYRPDELSPEKVHDVIHPAVSDGTGTYSTTSANGSLTAPEFPRSGGPKVAKITLCPLSEDDIAQYVSATLCRPIEEILPLALVLQSKTAGNPFYMREMLSACHRKKCIWYDYRDSQWHYDLDRLFDQFQGEKDYDILDTNFITHRLAELPPAARAVLAWASLVGTSFSFELISRLMSGEFDYDDEPSACQSATPKSGYTEKEAIDGLQAVIQNYIIVPSETDDRFRFAHDRYIQASAALKECNALKMHFIIAQTLLKYYAVEEKEQDSASSHICEAVDIIKRRVPARREFRRLLMECARWSTENGARPTAAKYYNAAVELLQDNPWAEESEDALYDENIQLYLRSAECYLFMGQHGAANRLLSNIFANAKTAIDKAPAFVLQSRIYAQNGNSQAAVTSLKECLGALGVQLDGEPTWEKCDERFERLSTQVQTLDRAVILNPTATIDPTAASIGAVLAETVGAAWWSDCLRFYHLTLVMLEMHLTHGVFPQSGMAFVHFGTVALFRFNMSQFAVELGTIAQELIYQNGDSFTLARGFMLYPFFIGHIHQSMALSLTQLEDAVEYASTAGDRMSTILAYGLYANVKFFGSENCADLEAFCQYGCEEIPNWYFDTRGGALLLAVRQTCRALQGKTRTQEPLDVLSDEQHNAVTYKKWLDGRTQHSNRSKLLYESMELAVLFLYGHYERAVEIGSNCVINLKLLWTARNSRLILLFYGLSLTGRLLRAMQDPRSQDSDFAAQTEEVVKQLTEFARMIKEWAAVSDVNYLSWSRLLEAQVSELSADYGQAIRHYEEALDHSTEHSFIWEEALGNYLMAGFFIRRKARRSARAALLDAVGLYRQMSATGVASTIEDEHSLLLHGPTRNHRTAEAGVQTDFVADTVNVQYRTEDAEENNELAQVPSNNAMSELKGERLGAWRGSMNMQATAGAGLPALDMIDLHAILVSSQVISSVLQVDELLQTMCDVILQTCGGSASRAAIVVQENDANTWCIAASGDPDNGASAHKPGLSLGGTSLIAENVVLYCTRFLESVFLPDLISDERFGNVNESWLQRNPSGRAIIAIPICHGTKPLLGVLYLEGEPGSFTDRNVSVLQLLVNQIGISYSNALSMKHLEKVSAENRSMVTVQKRALAKALEAETKAKDSEAIAKRNVKIAEEAAKAKAIFLANVSHELRTPLNGVIGNSELLRDSELNREQLDMADSIRVSADLLLTVINDILDFSKMEADKMKLFPIAFNPEEMVREVVRAVSYSNREKTSKKNVRIIQDINLPSMLIYGDPIRLHQVLGNLIGNSLKFTEDGSITIGARLDSETAESATLTFWVRDTGIGIPAEQLAKLFQPFSQADASTARKYGGSGLGLSICKSLIEIMMKGKIQLQSEETVGTTAWFTVTFEKAKADVSAGDAQLKSSPPIDRYLAVVSATASPTPYLDLTHLAKEDIRICVAEDNPINQKIAIQYVQRLGYSGVVAYENGLKAVEGLRQKANEGRPYHIVLMDVQMPVLDGYEATKLIRKDPIEAVRKILVIAMTASAIQGDREKCLAAGMNDYLAKPVRSEVLKKKLDTYIVPPPAVVIESRPPPHQPRVSLVPDTNRSGRAKVSSPLSKAYSPSLTRLEPMEEEAVYNMPMTSPGLQALESPSLDGSSAREYNLLPIRDSPLNGKPSTSSDVPLSSSENRSDAGSSMDPSASQTQKRQPRKLTKHRSSASEVNIERSNSEKPLADKPKGVLTKKLSQRQGGTGASGDGDETENEPFLAG